MMRMMMMAMKQKHHSERNQEMKITLREYPKKGVTTREGDGGRSVQSKDDEIPGWTIGDEDGSERVADE